MKKMTILIVLIIHTLCIYSQNINNISNIQHDDVLFYFHSFTGPLNIYENRMIVTNQYSIIDCEILDNGELNALKVYETKTYPLEKSFIAGDRFYTFYTFDNANYLKVFDLTYCPMIEVFDIELPITLPYISSPFATDSFLVFPDFPMEGSYVYDIDTMEYQGFINHLCGTSTYTDSLLIKAYYSFYDDNIHLLIKIFEFDDALEFSEDNYIQEFTINNIYKLSNLKVLDNILYLMFFNNVVLYDISDIENVFEIVRISIPEIDNPSDPNIFYFTDAFLVDDYLITFDTSYGCNVYNVADPTNVYKEFHLPKTGGYSHFNNLQIIYPYLYVCSTKGFRSFDISNNFELVQSYFINRYDTYDFIGKEDYFTSVYNEASNSYSFYSVLSEMELFDLYLDVYVDQFCFCIAENKLFFLYRFEDSFCLNIYNILDHSLSLLSSNDLDFDEFIGIDYHNGYIYIQHKNNLNRNSSVYTFNDDGLSFFCTIPGRIETESGLFDLDYLVFNDNNKYVFRDINSPDSVLFVSNTIYNSKSDSFTHFANNVMSRISLDYPNSNLRLYNYDLTTQSFSQFLLQSFADVNVFNNIITENNNAQDINLFYTVLDNDIVEIGSKEQVGKVMFTYFYPEQNKFMEKKYSGFHVYSFDYTVSLADQVVEYEKDTYVYPNPIHGGDVNFKTSLTGNDTEICIYNIKGQLVKTSKLLQTKDNESVFTWDKKNNQNQGVASGVYFYKIQNDASVKTGKFLIIK
ncbi:MAG: T9SS type A sorting domain-containing protein [Candidatus Cloacimonadales bacterium]|nr:T9SS type A sorting domain-containing protein [Candidatus Cloacimonadales bacterium]